MSKTGFIRNHPVLRSLLYMLLISVVILIAVAIFVKIYSRHGQEYVMEELVGRNYNEVESTNLLNLRFVISDSIYNNDNEAGTILSQDPLPGTMIKKGRKIYLTIASREPEDIIMPDLIDMSLRQAVSQVMSEGFMIGRLNFVESADRNAILSQTVNGRRVTPGQRVKRGSVIDLTVGRGSSDLGTVVPVVIGKNREQAQRAIYASSLNISEHFNGNVVNKNAARIYKQEPECSDVKYPLGSSVSVWYCNDNEFESQRRTADREIDSLRRVADSLRRALEEENQGLTDDYDFDFIDIDDIW